MTSVLPPHQPRRCLVVDDDQIVHVLLGAFLLEGGYAVEYASSGVEAVAKASSFEPELIFMDIEMMEMDGLEATRQIRALPPNNRVPPAIVAFTSFGSSERRHECLEAGMDDFVEKPFSADAIRMVLQRWLH